MQSRHAIDYVAIVAGNKIRFESWGRRFRPSWSSRQSDALSVVNSTVSSGGVNPVSEATSTDYQHLYVANKGDSTLVEFNVAGNGALTAAKDRQTMSAEGVPLRSRSP